MNWYEEIKNKALLKLCDRLNQETLEKVNKAIEELKNETSY